MHEVILSRQALKDLEKLRRAGLANKAKELTDIVEEDPFCNPPTYKKLLGDLKDCYSRRINDQHRFVYKVLPNANEMVDNNGKQYKGIVHVLRMWTHYE